VEGGGVISDESDSHYDFERLERAVTALADRHEQLRTENAELRRVLREKDQHIGHLDEKLRAAGQRRHDVSKRIDDLIAQIDQLDSQFEAQEEL